MAIQARVPARSGAIAKRASRTAMRDDVEQWREAGQHPVVGEGEEQEQQGHADGEPDKLTVSEAGRGERPGCRTLGEVGARRDREHGEEQPGVEASHCRVSGSCSGVPGLCQRASRGMARASRRLHRGGRGQGLSGQARLAMGREAGAGRCSARSRGTAAATSPCLTSGPNARSRMRAAIGAATEAASPPCSTTTHTRSCGLRRAERTRRTARGGAAPTVARTTSRLPSCGSPGTCRSCRRAAPAGCRADVRCPGRRPPPSPCPSVRGRERRPGARSGAARRPCPARGEAARGHRR